MFSNHGLHLYKVSQNILNGFRIMKGAQFLYNYKRHNSVKIVRGVILPVLRHCLSMVNICPIVSQTIEWFKSYEADKISKVIIIKGHFSLKILSGVTVLIHPILSNHGLHLYQVLQKYLEKFQSY